MNWTVTWLPTADQALIDIWISAPDRAAVTAAADQIDADLTADPLNAGESRGGDTRIHIVSPLAVYFDVDDVQHEVSVWAVWRVP
jgi:hypothetical protein